MNFKEIFTRRVKEIQQLNEIQGSHWATHVTISVERDLAEFPSTLFCVQ